MNQKILSKQHAAKLSGKPLSFLPPLQLLYCFSLKVFEWLPVFKPIKNISSSCWLAVYSPPSLELTRAAFFLSWVMWPQTARHDLPVRRVDYSPPLPPLKSQGARRQSVFCTQKKRSWKDGSLNVQKCFGMEGSLGMCVPRILFPKPWIMITASTVSNKTAKLPLGVWFPFLLVKGFCVLCKAGKKHWQMEPPPSCE